MQNLPSEKELNLQRYSTVFETYFANAFRQWQGRLYAYTTLLREMQERGSPIIDGNNAHIAELACGTGDMAAFLSQNLVQQGYTVHFSAAERDGQHVEWTKARLQEVGAQHHINQVPNAFVGSPQQLLGQLGLSEDKKPDLLLTEHALYGLLKKPDELKSVLGTMCHSVKPNGAVCTVMGYQNDSNLFHSEVSKVQRESSGIVKDAATAQGLTCFEITIPATMDFPKLSEQEWGKLRSGQYLFTDETIPNHIKRVVHLLEFWGRPIECMKADNSLAGFVDRVKNVVEDRNHILNIGARILVMPSNGSSPDFIENLEKSVTAINQQLESKEPLPLLTNAMVRILPELGKGSQERV